MRASALIVLSFLPACAVAQEIDWFSLDQGGGQSSGGDYSLSGTIGQPDPGQLSGGDYTLTGGFWAYITLLQVTEGPQLVIFRDPVTDQLTLQWPLPAEGWVLEEGTGLDEATLWTQIPPQSYVDDGDFRYVPVPDPTDRTFYRLSNSP